MRKLLGVGAVVAMSAGLGVGCAEPEPARDGVVLEEQGENPLESGAAFVAIPRDSSEGELAAQREALSGLGKQGQALLQSGQQSFYLAISKAALDKKWFFSGFMNNIAEASGLWNSSGGTMGSDVVGFRVQNGKLFIYRNDKGSKYSDVIDPNIIVDAYPIVTGLSSFNRLGGSGEYILVNPAGGLNNFGLTPTVTWSSVYSAEPTSRLAVDLTYLQNFKQLDDGASFQTVISGRYEGIENVDLIAASVALTTTLSIREYKESADFVPMSPPATEHFVLGARRVQTDQASVKANHVIKWNVHPGMKPIEWVITGNATALGEKYGIPIVDVIKQGVESWNTAFGFPVLSARLAVPGEEVGRDDRNFIDVDSALAAGAAYADPRSNPDTGEIRGAYIYFPAAFFANNFFSDDPPAQATSSSQVRVRWNGLTQDEVLCDLAMQHDSLEAPAAGGPSDLTAKEKFARYVQSVVTHEVGHTLGLRHNFKGSLVPPSSSVMDYLLGNESLATPVPQAYDIAAIKYLYGLSTELPTQPFCTDRDTGSDPECFIFDRRADPLNQYWGPTVTFVMANATLLGDYATVADYLDYYGTPVLNFVRAGTPTQADQAWTTLIAQIGAPLAPELAASPEYAEMADKLTNLVLTRLYTADQATRRGIYWTRATPLNDPYDPAVVARITEQLSLVLLNADGIRSFETRRLAVDILKQLQSVEAYQLLLDARAALNTALVDGSLSGEAATLTTDLVARIDAATSPYFE